MRVRVHVRERERERERERACVLVCTSERTHIAIKWSQIQLTRFSAKTVSPNDHIAQKHWSLSGQDPTPPQPYLGRSAYRCLGRSCSKRGT